MEAIFAVWSCRDTYGGLQGSRIVDNKQAPWRCLFQMDLLTGRPFLLSGAAGILLSFFEGGLKLHGH